MNPRNKPLTRKINLYYIIDGNRFEGVHGNLLIEDVNKCHAFGDCSHIFGTISKDLIGDVSGLYGNVTGFVGDATGIEGNVDSIQKPIDSVYSLETFTKVIV